MHHNGNSLHYSIFHTKHGIGIDEQTKRTGGGFSASEPSCTCTLERNELFTVSMTLWSLIFCDSSFMTLWLGLNTAEGDVTARSSADDEDLGELS